jgi:pyruvate kinase
VRSGDLAEPVQLASGDTWTFTTQLGVRGENRAVSVNYEGFTADVAPGDILLVDGGILSFRVDSIVSGRDVVCRCLEGGELASRRHLNVRGKSASLPSITAKDWEDIAFGVAHGVDFFALSFVNSADVVLQLKAYCAERGAHARVLAKIESAASVANLTEILTAADGAMVARGDLGAEMPVEEVPMLQEEIIRQCRNQGKPVIVATNMLESMIVNAIPTRAEVSDIAIAVREGADAVMLSGETAYGAHPMKALAVMATVSARTERAMAFAGREPLAGLARILSPDVTLMAAGPAADGRPMTAEERAEWDTSALLALHASAIARAKGTPILVFTRTGNMAALLAQQRPTRPTFAVTNSPEVMRRLALYHGVVPIAMEFSPNAEETFAAAMALLKTRGLMRAGEEVVVLQSGKQPIWRSERTHIIQVRPLP